MCSIFVIPLYNSLTYFLVKVISNKFAISSSQFLYKVVHFKQRLLCWFSFSHILGIGADLCYLSLERLINFLDPPLVYIKFLFPINKQFSIDSFLDCDWFFYLSQPDHGNILFSICLVNRVHVRHTQEVIIYQISPGGVETRVERMDIQCTTHLTTLTPYWSKYLWVNIFKLFFSNCLPSEVFQVGVIERKMSWKVSLSSKNSV